MSFVSSSFSSSSFVSTTSPSVRGLTESSGNVTSALINFKFTRSCIPCTDVETGKCVRVVCVHAI